MIRTELIAPVSELLQRQAARFPQKTAYRDAHRAIAFGELEIATANFAAWLRQNGVERGKTVAIWLPNSVDWIVACLATLRAGAVAVPISYDATQKEVAYRLDDAECALVVTRPERDPELDEMRQLGHVPARRVFVGGAAQGKGSDFSEICATPSPGIELEADDIDATSYIVYTSGTTGRAKGVLLSTRALLWATAACWAPILDLSENDKILSPLPLFHSYALTMSVLTPLSVGCEVYIMEKFSTRGALDLLKGDGFTIIPGVPTMYHYLLEMAGEDDRDAFKGVRHCVSAGAIMPSALNKDFEEHFNVELLDSYGITEMSTMVTMNWPGGHRMPGSCGLPLPGVALRVIDPVSGLDVDFGQEGELICRGPNLMLGYNRKPDETAAALRNGWYHTGDLARIDKHGFVTITGRLKEIIIRGGQNIAPAEIEETILALEEVLDCAVVGVPHSSLGEVPYAFIVGRDNHQLDPETVKQHCAKNLSGYKTPAEIVIVSEIPRTGSGKIMRFRLREIVVEPA